MSRRIGLVCPVAPAHGPLLGWPSARWFFYCPHVAHALDGSRAFFTTAEVEAGIDPTPRSASDPGDGRALSGAPEAAFPPAAGHSGALASQPAGLPAGARGEALTLPLFGS